MTNARQLPIRFEQSEVARLRKLLENIEQELLHTRHDDNCWANGRIDPHNSASSDKKGGQRDCVCQLDYLLELCRQRKPEVSH